MATVIEAGRPVFTLINVMTVEPERQQELLDVLITATREHNSKREGFISANFHASPDGTRVANYTQWVSREAWYSAMLETPEGKAEHAACRALCSPEVQSYEVIATFAGAGS